MLFRNKKHRGHRAIYCLLFSRRHTRRRRLNNTHKREREEWLDMLYSFTRECKILYKWRGACCCCLFFLVFRVFLAVDTFWQLVRAEADRENKEQQQQHEVSPVTKDMQLSQRAGIYKSAVAAWNRRRPAAAPSTAARSICLPHELFFLKSDRISTSFYHSISCWRSIKIHLAY